MDLQKQIPKEQVFTLFLAKHFCLTRSSVDINSEPNRYLKELVDIYFHTSRCDKVVNKNFYFQKKSVYSILKDSVSQ
jgi:hypothetical protein